MKRSSKAKDPGADSEYGKGHGTGALGPGDTSDSGSDMQGPGLSTDDTAVGLDTGTTDDPDRRPRERRRDR